MNKKKYNCKILSNKKCACGCGNLLKQNLIDKNPDATHIYKHYRIGLNRTKFNLGDKLMEKKKEQYEHLKMWTALTLEVPEIIVNDLRDRLWKFISENFVPVEAIVRQGVPQPVQTAGRVVYAVKGKGKYFLLHISKNENELDEKIQNAYWMARGLQPSGNNYKVEDFMKDMEKVKVTIEKL